MGSSMGLRPFRRPLPKCKHRATTLRQRLMQDGLSALRPPSLVLHFQQPGRPRTPTERLDWKPQCGRIPEVCSYPLHFPLIVAELPRPCWMPQNSELSPAKRLGKAEALLGLEVSLTWTYDYIDLCPKTAGIEFHVEGP